MDPSSPSDDPTLAPHVGGLRHYLCLVYQDEARLGALPAGGIEAIVGETLGWLETLRARGRHVFSAGLQSARTATTLRHRHGKLSTTDGPFAETKEHLGGFALIAARDLNEAIAIADELAAVTTGTIEVRPLLTLDAEPAEPLDRRIAATLRSLTRGSEMAGFARRTTDSPH